MVHSSTSEGDGESSAQRLLSLMTVAIRLTVNGVDHPLTVDPRRTLLDCLRENLGLMGAKKGCDHGQCGACTVVAGGVRINSCLSLAALHDGEEVSTIEGLGAAGALHPLQEAFLAHDALQCGFCTPGQVMSALAMLEEAGDPSWVSEDLLTPGPLSDDEIRERMGGNLCRCACYPNILAAIRDVILSRARGS